MKGWCECIKPGTEEEERKRRKEKRKWQDAEGDEGRKERGTVEGVFYISRDVRWREDGK